MTSQLIWYNFQTPKIDRKKILKLEFSLLALSKTSGKSLKLNTTFLCEPHPFLQVHPNPQKGNRQVTFFKTSLLLKPSSINSSQCWLLDRLCYTGLLHILAICFYLQRKNLLRMLYICNYFFPDVPLMLDLLIQQEIFPFFIADPLPDQHELTKQFYI